MTILDRYITRMFLTNFVILLVVFMSLFVIGDVIIDLDEFVQAAQVQVVRSRVTNMATAHSLPLDTIVPLASQYAKYEIAEPIAKEMQLNLEQTAALQEAMEAPSWRVTLQTIWVIFDYDGPMLLLIYVYFSGLLVVAAAGFTFAGLARSGEVVAMVAGGISMYRVAMPVLIVGCVLNSLTIFSQELVIPGLAPKLARSKSALKRQDVQRQPVLFAADGQGNLLSAGNFQMGGENQDIAVLTEVTILKRDTQGRAVSRIIADQAIWSDDQKLWELAGGMAFERPDVDRAESITMQEHRMQAEVFQTDLSPTLLMTRRAAIFLRLLSIRQLKELLHHPKVDSDEVRKIMHGRLSLLVMNVLMLAIGLPFFINRITENLLMQSIKAAGICIGAWSSGLVIQQMGATDLNPVAAAWLPVVLYIPVSAWLLQTVKT